MRNYFTSSITASEPKAAPAYRGALVRAWFRQLRSQASARLLPLLLLTFFCNTLLWAVVINIGHPPDEFSHFDYVRHLAINHSLPVYGKTYYIHNPTVLHAHASLPPLYYLLGTPLQMALRDASVTYQVLALRALSTLLGAVTVALVYLLGRRLVPARPAFALAAAALVGFNPMFTFLSASVNSDNLINLIYAALLLWLACGLEQPRPSYRWLIGLGLLLGAGLITKQTIIMGGIVSALTLLWMAWRQTGRRLYSVLIYGGLVGVTAFLVSGWYFIRNWWLFGHPTGLMTGTKIGTFTPTPYRSIGSVWDMVFNEQTQFLNGVFRGLWGVFDGYEVWQPVPVYNFMNTLLVLGLLGALLWPLRSWKERKHEWMRWRLIFFIIGGLTLVLTFSGIVGLSYFIDYQPQGRYLFAALAPLAMAFVGGWEQVAGLLKLRLLAAPLITVLMLGVNALSLVNTLAPAHHATYLKRLPAQTELPLQVVSNTSAARASFVAQQPQIRYLEMILTAPQAIRGPLIWRISRQGATNEELAALLPTPKSGLACLRIDVARHTFAVGQTYDLTLEAPAVTEGRQLITALAGAKTPRQLDTTDLELQVIYPSRFNWQELRRLDYLLRSDAPHSLRGQAQRLLYPLCFLLLLGMAAVALTSLRGRPFHLVGVLSLLGIALVSLSSTVTADRIGIPVQEVAATPGAPPLTAISLAPTNYKGSLETADCSVISGWAMDTNRPNTPIKVDIYDGALLLATVPANLSRRDLGEANQGKGQQGFSYVVPPGLKDGWPHTIEAKFSGTDLYLPGPTKPVTCGTRGPIIFNLIQLLSSPQAKKQPTDPALRDLLVQPSYFNLNGDNREVLYMHPTSSVTYQLQLPEGAYLRTSFAMSPQIWQPARGDGVEFAVELTNAKGSHKLFNRYIDPKNVPEDRKWHDLSIDLSAYGGQQVSLILSTNPGPAGNTLEDWAGWAKPLIVTPRREHQKQN